MNRKRILAFLIGITTLIMLTGSALALDESEVQTAIANSSREQVSGNIFIWFLCAIAFLKISQKIDSFMASLGINVGRTGGSMMAELMIAGRALAGGMSAAGHSVASIFNRGGHSGGGGSAAQPAGSPFSGGGGGLVGRIHRAAGNAATGSVTGNGGGLGSVVGGAMFDQSLQHGGQFGTDVTRAVAMGSIATVGTMKGAKAAQALSNYLGYNTPAGQTGGSTPGGPAPGGDAPGAPDVDGVSLMGGAAVAAGEAEDLPNIPTQAPATAGPTDTITLDGGSAGSIPTPEGTDGPAPSAGAMPADAQQPIPSQPPTFSHVEIGGGRITGYETPAEGGEARQFAMYSASQYMEPTGDYEVVKTVDGESWYKQYAVPTVQKTPKEVTDKGVVYDQKIVQQLPQIPKRKDKV